MRRALLIFVAVVSVPRVASAQGGMPLGPEFRVNTYTPSAQRRPLVAADSVGNFVVVWTSSFQDGSNLGVFGQRYAAAGPALGFEFRVNTYTSGIQHAPSLGADAAGNVTIIWGSDEPPPGGAYCQRYDTSGAPVGPEFLVNGGVEGDIAAAASGNFVVVWYFYAPGPGQDVFGQRYASSGVPLGLEFRVNTDTTYWQDFPSVASDAAGNFVVVWMSHIADYFGGTGLGVFGQRYAASGTPLGPEFRVNTYITTSPQFYPSVAADSAGNFIVVWNGAGQSDSYGIFGQRYASSGAPLGSEFRVNTFTPGAQFWPAVTADASGNFVVVWSSPQDGSSRGIFGQRYASSGAPLGAEFRVNTHTPSSQSYPSVVADPSGNFVVVWQSYGQDGSYHGIFGQRYGQMVPVEMMHVGVE